MIVLGEVKHMLARIVTTALLVLVIATTPMLALSDLEQSLVGTWQGELSLGQMKLRLVLHFENTDGRLSATMDSPDQGAKGITVDSVLVEGDSLRLKLTSLGAAYNAVYYAKGDSLSGTFMQAGMDLPLTLLETDSPIEVKRPQEPQPPFPYTSEEVTFFNERDSITLAGTFTVPDSGEPFPAVVLISGSGPQNRNEEVFGHKPFMVIADYLTRHGIAVLRFDDRGVGESEGDFFTATSEDFASDVEAAVRYLKRRTEIDPSSIGLIGHSEGGIIAPMVAVENDEIAFIVLLAGTGVPGSEVVSSQEKRIMETSGLDSVLVRKQAALSREMLKIAVSDIALADKRVDLREFMEARRELIPEEQWDEEMLTDVMIDAQIEQYLSPWMQFFLTYDPSIALRKVDCPVLVLNGELDLQVIPEQNLPAIEVALQEGENTSYKIVELEGLNHLFQHAESGHPTEYSRIEETFAPEALEIMTAWITEIVK